MAAVHLPPALKLRFAALAGRIRRQRVIRGVCAFAVVVVLTTTCLVLLDAAFDLPVMPRCVLQVATLGVVVFSGWRFLVKPYREKITLEHVARRLEETFPELRERLVTLVDLIRKSDAAPGSSQLLASVARDTDHQSRTLRFSAAASSGPVVRFTLASGLILLLAVGMIAALPGAGERVRRAWLPWYRPVLTVPYRVVVTSGNPVVRRGETVTLSAYVEGWKDGSGPGDEAVLVIRTESGQEIRLPMVGDAAGSFHLKLPPVEMDLEYRIEVGVASSPPHTLLVADPVELADGTTTEIIPPPYAVAVVPRRSTVGLIELNGLQFSTARIALRFSRPAATAFLEWHPDGLSPGPGTVLPLDVAPDRMSATATVTLAQNGTLRVVLANENGPRRLRTEVPIPVRAVTDTPPRFEQISGLSAQARQVRPNERILMSFAASDDVGIGTAELEYAIGPTFQPQRIPIPMMGRDPRQLEGRTLFELANRISEGQTIRFRLRISDCLRHPAPVRDPQVVYFPPDGWSEFTVSALAPSLEQQDYFGQRDTLNVVLHAAEHETRDVAEELDRVRTEAAGLSPLPLDHRIRIDRARERLLSVVNRLQEAARIAALTPDLRALAASVVKVANGPLAAALGQLTLARTDGPVERGAALAAAGQGVIEARATIAVLLVRNAQFAQYRLDRHRLALLAYDQAALTERIAAGGDRSELHANQLELLKRLRTTIGESDPLLHGFNESAGRKFRTLAIDTRTLTTSVHSLDTAARDEKARVRGALLAAAVKAQNDCSTTAERLQARFGTAARFPGIGRLRLDDFRKTADLIAQDKILEALVELETLAADGERIAAAVEKLAEDRSDAKIAARQLAAWQSDLRRRFIEATQARPFAQLPELHKAELRAEQGAIGAMLVRLRFPPGSNNAHIAALAAVATASEQLDGDGRDAADAMKLAAEALSVLAEQTSAVPTRLMTARLEFDRIRAEQESIHFTVEQIIRPFLERPLDAGAHQALAKKLDGILGRVEVVISRMAALDLPGFEHRQARVEFALRHAARDLAAIAPYDILASQSAVTRELDRLTLALDTPPAPDDRVLVLAAKQDAIAKQVTEFGPEPSPRQLEALVFAQREVQKGLEHLPAPEAPTLLHAAKEAVKLAEYRDETPPDELVRRTAAAAAALRRLADSLNGGESPLDRVRRLAANRSWAADEARRLAGSRFNPDASSEARRQLNRELDELAATRVGFSNQVLKRDVIRAYLELQKQNEPDRQFAAQKGLAELLGTLAARLADLEDLAFPRPPDAVRPAIHPEDRYLPSKSLAVDLRALTAQVRVVRDQVKSVNGDLIRELKPLAMRRAEREDELADSVAKLSERIDAAAREAPPADASARSFRAAAAELRRASKLLAAAAENDRLGQTDAADTLRAEAKRILDDATARTHTAIGPPPWPLLDPQTANVGESLREAELAMRATAKELEPGGDLLAATQAAKQATEALDQASHALNSERP